MSKQAEKPTVESIIAAAEAELRDRLVAAGAAAYVDETLAAFRKATVALAEAVREWPKDLAPDPTLTLDYVRAQVIKEAAICGDNALVAASRAAHLARDHWRAVLDAERRRKARAQGQWPA